LIERYLGRTVHRDRFSDKEPSPRGFASYVPMREPAISFSSKRELFRPRHSCRARRDAAVVHCPLLFVGGRAQLPAIGGTVTEIIRQFAAGRRFHADGALAGAQRHLRLASGLGNVLLLQRGILQMASKIALWRRWEWRISGALTKRSRRLPACQTILNAIGNLLADGRQVEEFLFAEDICGFFGKLPIRRRLVPKVIIPIHTWHCA
jgi:hypothetical protein